MPVAPKEKQGLWGIGPCRPLLSPPAGVCVIYSVWERIDPQLFEQSVSSLPWTLISDLWRDSWCTHAHTYQHTLLTTFSTVPPAFGREIMPLLMCLSYFTFPRLGAGWRIERGVHSLSLAKSTINETLAQDCSTERNLLGLRR